MMLMIRRSFTYKLFIHRINTAMFAKLMDYSQHTPEERILNYLIAQNISCSLFTRTLKRHVFSSFWCFMKKRNIGHFFLVSDLRLAPKEKILRKWLKSHSCVKRSNHFFGKFQKFVVVVNSDISTFLSRLSKVSVSHILYKRSKSV